MNQEMRVFDAHFFWAEPMYVFFLNTWFSGLRSRSFQAVLLLGLIMIGMAFLTGYFSPRQPKTVVMDVGFSAIRISTVLLVLFWVQDHVGREINRKGINFTLSYPIPRASYLVGRYFGILALALVSLVILGLLLTIAVLAAGGSYSQKFEVALGFPFWATMFGIWVDAAVIAAFALLVSSFAVTALLPFAVGAAFALGSRSLGTVRDYLVQGAEGDRDLVANFLPWLDRIQWVVPDLSRLDWRTWPMYGLADVAASIPLAVAMALAYSGLALLIAAFVFSRRNFE